MRWTVRLGSLFGIPIYLHTTFLMLLGVIALMQTLSGGLAAGIAGVAWVSTIFACVVLHEFGHALMARRFGIETRDVTLLPIGGLARLERMPRDPRQELWIALAGPAVNVAIAALASLPLVLSGAAFGVVPGGSFLGQLVGINVALALFNMLPAFPMDGGRVLRAVLARQMTYTRATDIAASIGRGMAVLLGVGGLLWNPMLLFIAVFVWFGAGQEAAMVRRQFHREPEIIDAEIVEPGVAGQGPRTRRRYYRIGPVLVYRDEPTP